MLPSDLTHLTPSQVDELRRKLEAADCHPPPQARTLAELAGAFATLRRRHGLPAGERLDAATLRCLDGVAGAGFGEVLRDELDMLRPACADPAGAAIDAALPPDRERLLARAHGGMLVGLALSGGGVRSATFSLGALQALARHGLLRRIDYLSSVSGGGFAGGWLSRCLHAHGGDIAALERTLAPPAGSGEAPELRFLRQYSNYLAPQGGMFSADTWTLFGTYLRNTGLNLVMLLAWMCALLLLPRFAVWAVHRVVTPGGPWSHLGDAAWITGVLLFLFAVFCIALSISSKPESSRGLRRFPLSQAAVLWCINLPLLLAGFLGSLGLWRHGGTFPAADLPSRLDGRWTWLLAPGLVYFIVWACGWYLAHDRSSPFRRVGYTVCAAGAAAVLLVLIEAGRVFAPGMVALLPFAPFVAAGQLTLLLCWAVGLLLLFAGWLTIYTRLRADPPLRDLTRAELGEGLSHFLCAMGALTLGTLLLLGGLAALPDPAKHPLLNNAIALGTFGMPLMMALFAATMTLMIGLVGRLYSDASREWWSRQGAWTAIFALGWLAVYGVCFFCAPLLHWAWLTYEPWSNLGTLLGWLAMTAFGLKAGSGVATGARTVRDPRLDLAARLAPYVFAVGIVALLSSLVQAAVARPRVDCPGARLACVLAAHAEATLATSGTTLTLALAGLLGAALLLGWRVDINKFSLYMLYRNRVVRAWFGAANRTRRPHPFTGFDPNDDLLLSELRYARPYPIVNTALNLVGGQELAWQTRRTASFAFTPRWCGYQGATHGAPFGCYRPTEQYAARSGVGSDDDAGVRLGMAVALSGAAASPNMGAHSSAPLNFLMTMFNVRLGRWCPNPRRPTWTSASPPIGLFSLLAELFGQLDADAPYVHLSDGGHFDNLGIYELVRRRCRLVIALDVGSDRQLAFEDLGNTIRRCATDLHVRIELDVSRMAAADSGLCGASCAAGTIRYSQADRGAPDGVLLYIKPAIVGSENADLLNYRKLHPDYPHESIADQWFDEAQFESYRALGEHVVECALRDAARGAMGANGELDVAALCAQLLHRHGPASRTGTTTAMPHDAVRAAAENT